MTAPTIGLLALQGGFAAHQAVLERLGARCRRVRAPEDLQGLDGLVLPGGESTTMMLGIEREQLAVPLAAAVRTGMPVLATCAGLIILDNAHLELMDITAERNAFGRQVHSFEEPVDVSGIEGGPMTGVFIRAPRITSSGEDVEILAAVGGQTVAARQGAITAVAFHPELGGDDRLHAAFLAHVVAAAGGRSSA